MRWFVACLVCMVGCIPEEQSQPDVQPWMRRANTSLQEDVEAAKKKMDRTPERPGFYQRKEQWRQDVIRRPGVEEGWTEESKEEYYRVQGNGVI